MFKEQTTDFIKQLISVNKPKKVIVCMIYFPDEAETGSWADFTLSLMGYNSNPSKLQVSIQQVFQHATSEIVIEGTEVVPCAFYQVLDGKTSSDYIQRVEPSSQGGRKLAEALMEFLI